jgi:hypothetical protein
MASRTSQGASMNNSISILKPLGLEEEELMTVSLYVLAVRGSTPYLWGGGG